MRHLLRLVSRFYHAHYHPHYRFARHVFAFDATLVAIMIGLLVVTVTMFVANRPYQPDISISVSLGQEQLTSGGRVPLSVTVTNATEKTFTDNDLVLRATTGIVFESDTHGVLSDKRSLIIPFVELGPKETRTLLIPGVLWTNVDSEETIFATLFYGPSERMHEETTPFFLRAERSVIEARAIAAAEHYPFEKTPFALTLLNHSSGTLPVSTALWRDTNQIPLPSPTLELPTAKPYTFSVTGTALADVGRHDWRAEVTLERNGKKLRQVNLTKSFFIKPPAVEVTIEPKNSALAIEAGETYAFNVQWTNKSPLSFGALSLELTTEEGAWFESARGRTRELVLPLSTTILEPSATATSTVTVRFSTKGLPSTEHITLTPRLILTTPEAATTHVAGAPLKLPVAATVQVNALTRYYSPEGDQLGRGPLPPTVGETTRYLAVLEVVGERGRISNPAIELTSAPGTRFTGKFFVDEGEVGKTSTTSANELHWEGSRLRNVTTTWFFEVALTPTEEQIGTIPLLVSARFNATDETTGRLISSTFPSITTVLAPNDKGRGAGARVVR